MELIRENNGMSMQKGKILQESIWQVTCLDWIVLAFVGFWPGIFFKFFFQRHKIITFC